MFKRIPSKDIHALLQDNLGSGESIFQFDEGAIPGESSKAACKLGRPSGSNVICVDRASSDECSCDPFLLLDIRSPEIFAEAHISKARSYPALDIRRDKMTVEIMRFKQNENKPIIVYSDHEKEAIEIGTLLVQKHFPNVGILATSFTKYAARFQEDITGEVKFPAKKPEKKRLPNNVYVPKRVYTSPENTARSTIAGSQCPGSTVLSAPWRPV
jgi:rhodanese-related sulfurtransferase